jgi:DNA polymerase zeta
MSPFISCTEGSFPKITVLTTRVPHHSHADLTRWYRNSDLKNRLRVLHYYLSRCRIDLEILEAQELIARVW